MSPASKWTTSIQSSPDFSSLPRSFADLALCEPLQKGLAAFEFAQLTPIQQELLPAALAGRDLLAAAPTGSGKTLAYLVPLAQKILTSDTAAALVLAPTRELAEQIMTVAGKLIGASTVLLVIGGKPLAPQRKALNKSPRFVVATPGRLYEHLANQHALLNRFDLVVVDEADQLLDLGFKKQLDFIIKHLRPQRQGIMVSATLGSATRGLARAFLNKPIEHAISARFTPKGQLQSLLLQCPEEQKNNALIDYIKSRRQPTLIFVKSRKRADQLANFLAKARFKAKALHGGMPQARRQQFLQLFRDSGFTILVATDVAARGLDVPQIRHVVHYDLPQEPHEYLHRQGRTARAGADGASLTLITPEDEEHWRLIQRFLESQT